MVRHCLTLAAAAAANTQAPHTAVVATVAAAVQVPL